MDEKVLGATLAGLLHDIGKFAQRAGEKLLPGEFDPKLFGKHGYHAALADRVFIREFVPPTLQRFMIGAVLHHQPKGEESVLINIADHWVAGERAKGAAELEPQLPGEARLIPILSLVELLYPAPEPVMRYKLAPLGLGSELLYPSAEFGNDPKEEYINLWKLFLQDLNNWKEKSSYLWKQDHLTDYDIESYLVTLLALLRKYLWCIPSATNWESDADDRTWPDVSLYDHLRLTAAIAACIAASGVSVEDIQKNDDIKAVQIIRGDLSGIQKFIYRLNRPQAVTENIAKRLRGRSFYLQILVEIVAEWLLRILDLPPVCTLFVGGGRFDLLVPFTDKVNKLLEESILALEKWLLQMFYGELVFHIVSEPLTQDDFADMRQAYRRLEAALEAAKKKNWLTHLTPDFYQPIGNQWHTCSVCQLTPLDEPGVCTICGLHAQMGRHLPHISYLGYSYGDGQITLPQSQIVDFNGGLFNVRVVLVRSKSDLRSFLNSTTHKSLFRINDTGDFIHPPAACSFRFLAKAAPLAKSCLSASGMAPVEEDDVLHFEAIAKLSTGAERIGVLKADVDHLGLIMSEGLNRPEKQLRPTISRIAALSSNLDLFFAGLLNTICAEYPMDKRLQNDNKGASPSWLNNVDGLFYILYSGGDDLFIVGPWDKTIRLAARIEEEFQRFTAFNPNMSLSAGYIQVKPHFPVQKFADLVDYAEKDAKKTRNALCAFNQRLPWRVNQQENGVSVAGLLIFSDQLFKRINEGKIPRGLISDIGRLYRQHVSEEEGLKPMWMPRLYYSLTRRLNKEVMQDIQAPFLEWFQGQRLLMPLSIVSLSMRKE
jgi:CRISPR-associated protein Csm1